MILMGTQIKMSFINNNSDIDFINYFIKIKYLI